MAHIVVTSSADADTAEIIAYLNARAGYSVVAKYLASFERLYEYLADFPDGGAPRPKVGPNIRIGIVSPYIVIYRHTEADSAVTVLRIVHGRRRISGKLLSTATRSS